MGGKKQKYVLFPAFDFFLLTFYLIYEGSIIRQENVQRLQVDSPQETTGRHLQESKA